MKTTFIAILLVVQAILSTSCMSTLGQQGSLNASTYLGAPQRVQTIYQTQEGYAFEAIYKNKDASQSLVFTTDKNGRNAKFADKNIVGVPIPFKRVSLREFYDRSSNRTPSGRFPYGFVTHGTGQDDSAGTAAGAIILTSLDWSVSPEFPRNKPDWAARVSQTPGAIFKDVALLPIMIPVAILVPNING